MNTDKNNIVKKLNLNNDILSAIDSGLKYNLNNFKLINSRKIKELNSNYLILKNIESNCFFIVDKNNAFYIDDCEYYTYRIKIKDVFFGSQYDLNKFINDNK
nr:hypothetical protein [uncultured Mediterranean phage uvMED]